MPVRKSAAAFLSLLLVAGGPAPSAAGPKLNPAQASELIEAIGPLKNPLYVRASEIKNFKTAEFKRAPELQVARLGSGPIRLDPRKTYLWLIDEAGTVHVAPIKKDVSGYESIGHVMLNGGRPARLGGEFVFVKGKKGRRGRRGGPGRWVMNNDSGRYGKKDPSVAATQLEAAKRLVEAIGIEAEDGKRAESKGRKGKNAKRKGKNAKRKGSKPKSRRLTFHLEFIVTPRLQDAKFPGQQNQVRKAMIQRNLGGYLLEPGKAGSGDIPKGHSSPGARLQWARMARGKLGLPTQTDRFSGHRRLAPRAMRPHETRPRGRTRAGRVHGRRVRAAR